MLNRSASEYTERMEYKIGNQKIKNKTTQTQQFASVAAISRPLI